MSCMMEYCDVGLYGLSVMGQNFALNIASHGFRVCVGNRSPSKVDITVKRAIEEGNIPVVPSTSPEDFVSKISRPRRIIILVMAGSPVDETISKLSTLMEPGDIIVDGGNEWYPNSQRRAKELALRGILFMGMGISGGEEGARFGPSLMPGGPRRAYDLMEPIFTKVAAQVNNDGACVEYIGPIGSGNYIKMVHNGIEYELSYKPSIYSEKNLAKADMQLIAEVYDCLRRIVGLSNQDMARQFVRWNEDDLSSYLIEITAKILNKTDDITGEGFILDYIMDKTRIKVCGRWIVQEAAEMCISAPTISASLDARYIYSQKKERVNASKILTGLKEVPNVSKPQIVEDLAAALYCSKISSFAQGISIIKEASKLHLWNLDVSKCVKLWKGGCIIRAKILDKIDSAFKRDVNLSNLMLDQEFSKILNARHMSWRRIVTLCIASGIACPALSSALSYFDSFRRDILPANLIQAQRDYFGGHTYERTDRPGPHHTIWTKNHKDIGDVHQRAVGETKELSKI